MLDHITIRDLILIVLLLYLFLIASRPDEHEGGD